MNTAQVIGLIFTSGVAVTVINQVGNYIFSRRKRKDDVEDAASAKKEKENTQITELRENTDRQFKEMRENISVLSETVNTLSTTVGEVVVQGEKTMRSQKALSYDRIRHLGLQYIRAGQIDPEDLRALTVMYDAYLQLPGADGFLVKLMSEVGNLRIKLDG